MHGTCSRGGEAGYMENRIRSGMTVSEALVVQLKQCGNRKDFQGGKLLHSNAIEAGCHKDRYVAHTLISMYSKCGSMQEARVVFEDMVRHDVVSWTVLILGYVENGESLVALDMFNRMDCAPNSITYVAALKACAGLASNNKLEKKTCIQKGASIHREARKRGFDKDVFVANTLMDLYSKCGEMLQAREVFDGMTHRNVVSWNVLIMGYVENGETSVGLDVFESMDCEPDYVSFVGALKACAGLANSNKLEKRTCLWKGISIHRQVRQCGCEKEVSSSLVDMYSKCGDMIQARDVFGRIVQPDVVSWTALMLGYVENGESLVALDMFHSMDCAPNRVTFVAALKACAALGADRKEACMQGLTIHKQARDRGLDKDVFVASTLVDMYSKCGDMLKARSVFERMSHRSCVSWNALILGYVENGESSMALDLFERMDCEPNHVTFVAALKACASLGALEIGQVIHDRVCELGLEKDKTVANCLVDFYGKCGNMAAAEEVFNRMSSRDIVSWNALMGGYSLLGNTVQVFSLMKRMQEGGVRVDGVTMLLILITCRHVGMVKEGERYFESMSRYGINRTLEHYTCMADMLGRANRLQEALSLVKSMPFEADSHVWTTLLGACKKWSNVEIGKVAFVALVNGKNKEDVSSAYVLMRNIYLRLGMREEGEKIEGERKRVRTRKKARMAWCYDTEGRIMRSFVVRNKMEGEVVEKTRALLAADR